MFLFTQSFNLCARGLEFSSGSSGVSLRLNAVAYGSSNFVAVGTNSTVISSPPESLTNVWRPASFPTAGLNLAAVTYGSNLFVAGGQNSAIFSSTNGSNWTARGNAFPNSSTIQGLSFSPGSEGTFVAVAPSALIRWAGTELASWNTATIANASIVEGYPGGNRIWDEQFCGVWAWRSRPCFSGCRT